MATLDDTDRRLLNALQADGRMTNQDLAQTIHLSPAACFDRVKRLRERGVITGYTALLNPDEVGLPLLIFVEVSLDRTTTQAMAEFAKAIRNTPQILECHMVAGGFDYLVKARVKDMAAYREFLGKTLLQKGVRETHTYAVMEEVKNTTKLPIK